MALEQIINAGLPVSAEVEDAAVAGSRPNIVVICIDQLRADFLEFMAASHCSNPAHRPCLFKVALIFAKPCLSAQCVAQPGVFVMTGRDIMALTCFKIGTFSLSREGLQTRRSSRANGYQTYGIGKMHTWPPRNRMGFDDIEINEEGRTAGFDYPDDYQQFLLDNGLAARGHAHGMGNNQYGYRPSPVPEWATSTGWTADRAMRFLRRRDSERPFFMYVSFDRPHPPLTPPAEYYDLYRDAIFPEPLYGDWTEEKMRKRRDGVSRSQLFPAGADVNIYNILRAYRLRHHIDTRLGQLGTLRETKVMDNTWLMLVTDHGDMT